MSKNQTTPSCVLFFCLLTSHVCLAIDWLGEAEITQQLGRSFPVESAIYLPSGEHSSLALYSEAKIPAAHGGVLLIHDIGGNADWPSVISPLRNQLQDDGWHTLSLQMPLPSEPLNEKEMGRLMETGSKRIQAGIQFFKDKGVYNLVIVAYRLGASIALNYLTTQGGTKPDVSALVVIGLYDHPMRPLYDSATQIVRVDMPVLDLVGALDSQQSLAAAQRRDSAARKADKKHYAQLRMAGADEQFSGLQMSLIRRISGWLRNQAPGTMVDKPKIPVDNAGSGRNN